jgi:hypothetical protein
VNHCFLRHVTTWLLAVCSLSWNLVTGTISAGDTRSQGSCLNGTCFESADDAGCRCEGPKTLFNWFGGPEGEEEEEEESPIETDRPDFTEASTTVGRGRVQLEMGYTYIRDDEDGTRVDAHSYPETLLRVGMLAEWFEFRLAWNYAVEKTTVAGASSTISNPEDLYVGVKLALTEQVGIFPEMALMPQMTVPTAPVVDGFGTGEVMPGVNWLYGWDINDFLAAGGSSQVNRARDDAGEFYTEFAQSFTIGYGLTDKLGAYTEWFALIPHGAAEAKPEHYFNGGFTYLLSNDLQLDIRAGVGLNEHADDFFIGSGASYRY